MFPIREGFQFTECFSFLMMTSLLITTYFLKVPYQIGEVFVTMTQDDVQDTLEAQKEIFEGEVTKLEEKSEDIKSQMSDLKTQLYAKFGNAINLEADDES